MIASKIAIIGMGVSTTASRSEGLMAMTEFDEIELVFDADYGEVT